MLRNPWLKAGVIALVAFTVWEKSTTPVNSQNACGVDDPRGEYSAPPYYYDPDMNVGCTPATGGGWHRYYGTPTLVDGLWGIEGTSIIFSGAFQMSEIQAVGATRVIPVEVDIE